MSDPTSSDSEKSIPRGKPSAEGRFLWISSLAAERITNELGATDAAFGMAVYLALCRLSSKEKNIPRIEATVSKIAGLARISYPKAAAMLDALEREAKVITIERRQRQKGDVRQLPHIYTLLSMRRNPVSSARHNVVLPARRNGAGTTEQASYYSENPKEMLPQVENRKQTTASSDAGSLASQGPASDAEKGSGCTGRF